MKRLTVQLTTALALSALAGSALAVSLSANGPAQPLPDTALIEDNDYSVAPSAPRAELLVAGSSALVPLMAADSGPGETGNIETTAATASNVSGKPVDDVSFVARATVNGRLEMYAAREAIPQLKDPGLRQLAEAVAAHHDEANARLSRIAEAKGWPIPGPKRHQPPPAGSASPDFDAKWTAEMIAGHERSVALYRAQAQGGEDKELRKYARDTLPAIEQQLELLRRSQK